MANTFKLPDILTQYTPDPTIYPTTTKQIEVANVGINKYNIGADETQNHNLNPTATNQIEVANIGTNRYIIGADEIQARNLNPKPTRPNKLFEPIPIRKNNGPLTLFNKRWYFRLVQGKKDEYKRARALMDDYTLNEISRHMVVCLTPDTLPGRKIFRNKDGKPIRIYAFFDSYLEFFEYMSNFSYNERAFFEIIFGELPQKPHFDIDINLDEFNSMYPDENIDVASEILREAVITGCLETLAENMVMLNLERDLLQYSSHGPNKRSYHIVLNNKCHDGNKEAKAFYDAVMLKVQVITNNKYLKFVDKSVYSPRQQFRLVGSQKNGSNRPKIFCEQFIYQGKVYTHIYNEDVTDIRLKHLIVLYESMVSFTSGCVYLPSLVPPKAATQNNLGDLPDLEVNVANHCLAMLREKMAASAFTVTNGRGVEKNRVPTCPFSIKEIHGHLILLKRDGPSYCPICRKDEPHENENPYIYIMNGKIYWDCRRCEDDTKKFFVGYLAVTIDEMQAGTAFQLAPVDDIDGDIDDNEGEFMFGDYNIGPPTLLPAKNNKINQQPTVQTQNVNINGTENVDTNKPTIYIPPPEQRRQNIQRDVMKIAKSWAQNKYIKREPEDLMGIRTLSSVSKEMTWVSGLSQK